jgi:hypothetical protein
VKREEFPRSSARQTELTGEAKMNLSRLRKLSRNLAIFLALSDARQFKRSRLEFRPFAVVEHYKVDVILTDFIAANSPLVSLLADNSVREQSLQQATVEKAIFPARHQQHLFTFTPSESISIPRPYRSDISDSPDEYGVNALVDLASALEVK